MGLARPSRMRILELPGSGGQCQSQGCVHPPKDLALGG